jgi:hypothetical protein
MAEGIGGRGLRWMLRGQERQANSGEVSKSCRYEGGWRSLLGLGFGGGRRRGQAHQVEFTPIEQFPLHLITGLQADGRSQGQGKADVEAGSLATGTDRLDTQRIGHGEVTFFIAVGAYGWTSAR